jgi:hypothetical protein
LDLGLLNTRDSAIFFSKKRAGRAQDRRAHFQNRRTKGGSRRTIFLSFSSTAAMASLRAFSACHNSMSGGRMIARQTKSGPRHVAQPGICKK